MRGSSPAVCVRTKCVCGPMPLLLPSNDALLSIRRNLFPDDDFPAAIELPDDELMKTRVTTAPALLSRPGRLCPRKSHESSEQRSYKCKFTLGLMLLSGQTQSSVYGAPPSPCLHGSLFSNASECHDVSRASFPLTGTFIGLDSLSAFIVLPPHSAAARTRDSAISEKHKT